MVTARSPKTHLHNGNGSGHDAPESRVAVFVDLDRTLLRGASGLVLSAAMHAEGLFEGRRSLPGERLLYGFYDLMGESLAFMAMVRVRPAFHPGLAGRGRVPGRGAGRARSSSTWSSPTPRGCWPSTARPAT